MAGAVDDRQRWRRGAGRPSARRRRRTWRRARRRRGAPASSAPGRRSHSGSWVPVPARRRLDASPATVLRRRSSSPGSVSVANIGWATQRSRNASTPSRSIAAASCVVARPPGGPLAGVVDAGRGADQHEALDEVRAGDGEVQAQAAAHRVADVRRPAAGRDRAARRRRRRSARTAAEPPWPGASTATTSWRLGQLVGDRVPRPAGLGEPVDEHEPPARRRAGRRRGRQPARCVGGQALQHLHEHGRVLGAGDRPAAVDDVRRDGRDPGLGGVRQRLGDLGLAAVAGEEAPGRRRRRGRPRPPPRRARRGRRRCGRRRSRRRAGAPSARPGHPGGPLVSAYHSRRWASRVLARWARSRWKSRPSAAAGAGDVVDDRRRPLRAAELPGVGLARRASSCPAAPSGRAGTAGRRSRSSASNVGSSASVDGAAAKRRLPM